MTTFVRNKIFVFFLNAHDQNSVFQSILKKIYFNIFNVIYDIKVFIFI